MEYDLFITDENGYPAPPEIPDWIVTAILFLVIIIPVGCSALK